jgi:hypothetical protein
MPMLPVSFFVRFTPLTSFIAVLDFVIEQERTNGTEWPALDWIRTPSAKPVNPSFAPHTNSSPLFS